jgi:ABC-type cobalamin/Fe3+-siderophores transport system ATPase subunit
VKLAHVQDYKRRLEATGSQWPVRLESFTFENIPSVGSGEIPFPSRIVILAGPNGVGKTTLLRALWATAAPKLAHDDPPTLLKLSAGTSTLSYLDAGTQQISSVTFTKGVVHGQAGLDSEVIHLDSSGEAKRHQEVFCEVEEVEDLINGVGFRTLDAKALEEVNYVSRRDYREIKVYEIEDGTALLPFFEVAYGNNRYDSRTMGAGELALFFLWWAVDRASQNSVVLIEEPETHLSPASQEALSHFLLKQSVDKQLNLIVTSHSHKIIGSFTEKQLVFLFRDGASIRTIAGLPPPALLQTIGIEPHVDAVVLVEDRLANVFLRQMLERMRPSLSRRIEISIRNGDGGITGILKRLNAQFEAIKIIGCYDGDLRGNVPVELEGLSTFLPGNAALEVVLRKLVINNPAALIATTGSQDVPAILFGLEGVDHHDWYAGLCQGLGLSAAQLFPMLFNIWLQEGENRDAANATLDHLTRLLS